jgi:RNA polymerase sigma-70 factor (ECF subfamily)
MDSGWLRKNSYDTSADAPTWGHVTPLPFVGSDEGLLEALHKGHPGAAKAFYDRYAEVIDRILGRILGAGAADDMPELIEVSFLRAIAGIARLRDPARLQAWVSAAAIGAARAHLRRRARERTWERMIGRRPVDGPSRSNDGLGRATNALYAVLDRMPVDERIVFALRVLDAMPPAEIAEVTGASPGRLRRRSRRAEARFVAFARKSPVLGPWLEKGARWSLPTLG